jgi:hypothetical protein
MKIITKKSVIFAALAVVLLATVLVISCNSPLDGISDKKEPSKPGTGKVKLTINNRNASRTILPALPASGNRKYLLILTGDGGTLEDFVSDVTSGTASGVPVGNYAALQVIMYDSATAFDPDTDDVEDLISDLAIGESVEASGPYNVDGVGTTDLGSHTIVLYTPGLSTGNNAGTGTFAYNITANTANGAAADRLQTTLVDGTSFVIQGIGSAYSGTGSTPSQISFNAETPISNIPSGYYYVIYTLTDKDPIPNVVYFYDIIHVNKNMKSLLTRTFTNDFFPDSVTPPEYGSIEISITGPSAPTDVTGSLSTTPGSGVLIGSLTNRVARVNITKGSPAADLIFKVTTPAAPGVTAVWQSVTGGVISTVTNVPGITVNLNNTTQEWTMTINQPAAIAGGTPTLVGDGPFFYQLQLSYSGSPFSTPSFQVYFVD